MSDCTGKAISRSSGTNLIYHIRILLSLPSIRSSYSSKPFSNIHVKYSCEPSHPRNDPSPDRGSQLPRAASLIISSLGFIHDLCTGQLQPDTVRGTPLDMTQYSRLFGTSRIPTEVRFYTDVNSDLTTRLEGMQDGRETRF